MKYARIEGNIAIEVIDFDPVGRFHPGVAALFSPVPDNVNQNAALEAGVWAPYIAPPMPPPLTEAEREALRAPPTKEEINTPIFAQLITIDLKSIRALREGNQQLLNDYEKQAAALRAKLVK